MHCILISVKHLLYVLYVTLLTKHKVGQYVFTAMRMWWNQHGYTILIFWYNAWSSHIGKGQKVDLKLPCLFMHEYNFFLFPLSNLNPYLRTGSSDQSKLLADAWGLHLWCQLHFKQWHEGAYSRVNLMDSKKVARAATFAYTKWVEGQAGRHRGKSFWVKPGKKWKVMTMQWN